MKIPEFSAWKITWLLPANAYSSVLTIIKRKIAVCLICLAIAETGVVRGILHEKVYWELISEYFHHRLDNIHEENSWISILFTIITPQIADVVIEGILVKYYFSALKMILQKHGLSSFVIYLDVFIPNPERLNIFNRSLLLIKR